MIEPPPPKGQAEVLLNESYPASPVACRFKEAAHEPYHHHDNLDFTAESEANPEMPNSWETGA